MDRHPVDGMRGLAQRLRQRRVREDGVLHALHGGLVRQHDARGGEQLGRLGADDVHAEHLVVLLVGDDLHEVALVSSRISALPMPMNGNLPTRTS